MSAIEAGPLLRFGAFELDPRNGELRKAGALIRLPRQPFQVLQLLAANTGQLLTREQIQREIWGDDTFVDFDRNLNVCITQIRSVLNDDSESPRFIQTVPRRGYRFVAPVERLGPPLAEPVPASAPAAPRSRRTITIVAVLGAIVIGSAAFLAQTMLRRTALPAPDSSRVMIAVLPFENISGSESDGPLIDGLAEELITQLGSIHPARLGVIARSSVMRYKRTPKSIDQIGSELGVKYVIEGAVRRADNRLRVTARLIKVTDQAQVWTESFESDRSSAAEMEQDAAARIAAAVTTALFPGSNVTTARPYTPPPAAREAYRDGRYLEHNPGQHNIQRGIERFEEAVKLDPGFAEAYAALADAHVTLARSGDHPEDNFPLAKTAAAKALALDDTMSEAHNALANALFWYDWKWSAAARHFRRAIEINPSYSLAHHDYAWLLLASGRAGDAVSSIHRAIAMDPLSARINVDSGWLLLYAHRYDETIEQNRKTLRLEPGLQEVHACLSRAYLLKKDFAGAKAEMLATIAQPEWKAELEKLPPEAAIRRLMQVQIEKQSDATNAYSLAASYAYLGAKGEALDALERAYQTHSSMLPLMWADPGLTGLHDEARFRELARRVGLN